MTPVLRRVPSPGRIGRDLTWLAGLLVSATVAGAGLSAFAAGGSPEGTAMQRPPSIEPGGPDHKSPDKETDKSAGIQDNASVATRNICDALTIAATANELPVDFFTRLIWQESRFAPDAISPKGAQGIAQFMPGTALLAGLANPFDPLEAIGKSGQLLHDLRREFGNLGLAAAAYNAGPGRVHDWLRSHRRLPRETLAYVRIITGHSVDEWTTGDQAIAARVPSTAAIRCEMAVTASVQANPAALASKGESVKPWGVEIVGGTTPENAMARFRDWRPKFEALVAGREPRVVLRGMLGQAGAARVRLGEDSRAEAQKLCAALKAAGTYCDVMRN